MRQFALLMILALAGSASAFAGGVQINVNFGAPYYYGYGPADVVYVERYVPVYDVPQVLYVARHARVAPSVIVGCYRGGWGWDRIYSRYRVPRRGYGGGYGGYYGGYAPARAFYSAPAYSYRGDRGYSRGRGHHYKYDRGRGRGGWR